MLALDARFTVLAIFCGLATQWAAPGATVHAAVISRTPDYSQPGAHSQHVLPWSGKGRPGSSKVRSEGGWKHKVVSLSFLSRVGVEADLCYLKRTNDFHPSNPFGSLIDGVISKIKRPHGHHKRSHTSILIPTNHGVTYAVAHSRRAETPLWRVGKPTEKGGDKDDNTRRGEDVSDGFVAIMVRSLLSNSMLHLVMRMRHRATPELSDTSF
jgi:hypothetical protein